MTATGRGAIEMVAGMTISGTIGFFVLLSGRPVFDVIFWRCLFGAAMLALVCAVMGQFRRGIISPRQFGLALLGGVALVINWILLFSAFPRASISIATAVYNVQPFMLVTMAALFFGEKLTLSRLIWLSVAFMGVLAVIQVEPEAAYAGNNYLAGIALALGAAFFYALVAVITRQLRGVPPHLVALIQISVGIVMMVLFANFGTLPQGAGEWAPLVTLGLVHTGLMYILIYSAFQKLPAHMVGALSFVYPVVTLIVDAIAFGVTFQPLQIAGGAAILIAAAGSTLGWTVPFGKKSRA